MPITKLSPADAREAIQEWTDAVSTLLEQVRRWAAEERPEWRLEVSTADVTEESLGHYATQVLEFTAPSGRLVFEPVGLDVFGARGRVDFYAWPSLYRVMLLRSVAGGEWTIRTGSGIDWPQPWSKDSFLAIADRLLVAK